MMPTYDLVLFRCLMSCSLFTFAWTHLRPLKYLKTLPNILLLSNTPQTLRQRLADSGLEHSVLKSFIPSYYKALLRLLLHFYNDLFHVNQILHFSDKRPPQLRKFCLLCDTIDDQRSFNTTTSWWRRLCKMIGVLTWPLSQWGSSVLMKIKLRTTDYKRACATDRALTSTSFCTQIWIEWPVTYKLMPETLRFPQSRGSRYCSTQSRICSPLRSLTQFVEREYHRSSSDFLVHTAYTTSTSSWSIICSYFSSVMNSLHELFPSIRITRIRTALNGNWTKDLLFAPDED